MGEGGARRGRARIPVGQRRRLRARQLGKLRGRGAVRGQEPRAARRRRPVPDGRQPLRRARSRRQRLGVGGGQVRRGSQAARRARRIVLQLLRRAARRRTGTPGRRSIATAIWGSGARGDARRRALVALATCAALAGRRRRWCRRASARSSSKEPALRPPPPAARRSTTRPSRPPAIAIATASCACRRRCARSSRTACSGRLRVGMRVVEARTGRLFYSQRDGDADGSGVEPEGAGDDHGADAPGRRLAVPHRAVRADADGRRHHRRRRLPARQRRPDVSQRRSRRAGGRAGAPRRAQHRGRRRRRPAPHRRRRADRRRGRRATASRSTPPRTRRPASCRRACRWSSTTG